MSESATPESCRLERPGGVYRLQFRAPGRLQSLALAAGETETTIDPGRHRLLPSLGDAAVSYLLALFTPRPR